MHMNMYIVIIIIIIIVVFIIIGVIIFILLLFVYYYTNLFNIFMDRPYPFHIFPSPSPCGTHGGPRPGSKRQHDVQRPAPQNCDALGVGNRTTD